MWEGQVQEFRGVEDSEGDRSISRNKTKRRNAESQRQEFILLLHSTEQFTNSSKIEFRVHTKRIEYRTGKSPKYSARAVYSLK